MTDAEYMKSIRKALHLSQQEMADKMGYGSQQAVSAIETGEKNMSGVARKFLAYIEVKEIK